MRRRAASPAVLTKYCSTPLPRRSWGCRRITGRTRACPSIRFLPRPASMTEGEDIHDIRRAVQALCSEFPGEYWREKDRERAYPGEFVDALTRSGFLAALIPEDFGGSGLKLDAAAVIMEEIQAAGCNGASAHAQMYIMNTLLRYGSEEQKRAYLPGIASGELRLQAFGVSEPTSGTD